MAVTFGAQLAEFTNTSATTPFLTSSFTVSGTSPYGTIFITTRAGSISSSDVSWNGIPATLLISNSTVAYDYFLLGVPSPTTGVITVNRPIATEVSVQAALWNGVLAVGTPETKQRTNISTVTDGVTLVTGPDDMALSYVTQDNPVNPATAGSGQTLLTEINFNLSRNGGGYKTAGTLMNFTTASSAQQSTTYLGIPLLSAAPIISDINALSFGHAL